MSTFKAVVLKASNQVKSDDTTNIKIRITHKRKQAYIPTDLYIPAKDMDSKSGMVKPGATNSNFINLRITNILRKYIQKDIELDDRKEYMTVHDIKKYILSGKFSPRQIDFFEFVEELAERTQTKGTRDQYLYTMASLKNFTGSKLPVSEINLNFLFRYETWMRSQNVGNGIINYMTTFRSLFNKCRDLYNNEDTQQILIPHYPFRKYKMPKRKLKSKEHILSLEELKQLQEYNPESAGEEFVKDMFLLMIYLIGIEAKDLFYLNKPSKGRVIYDRFKTDRDFSIKLEPEALEIINRYPGRKLLLNVSERFQHHKSFYRYINNYLKGERAHNITGIFPKLAIRKPVTTKWARHTWATIARNECRINKDDVALALGHVDSDNIVTDMYIKTDYTIIDEANRKVIDYIND